MLETQIFPQEAALEAETPSSFGEGIEHLIMVLMHLSAAIFHCCASQ